MESPETFVRPFRYRSKYMWWTLGIARARSWPAHEYHQVYDGNTFVLLPETETTGPSVSIEQIPPLTEMEANAAVRRFLSALAWATDQPTEISFGIGKHAPGGIGKDKGPVHCADHRFYIDYLPLPAHGKGKLCLALYREALGLENEAYAFLGFYKIINALYGTRTTQVAWINATVSKLTDHWARERFAEISQNEKDIGEYFYISGRCAVAHAFNEPVANPDDPQDIIRLREDLVLMKALARHLMETELMIQKPETYRAQHLYELEGFRAILGSNVVARLKAKAEVKPEIIPPFPKLSMQVRHHLARGTFHNMTVQLVGLENGMMALKCAAESELAAVILELDFVDERLLLNIEHIYVTDDDSLAGKVAEYDAYMLESQILMNGILEVWNAETGDPLGCTAPFLPLNMRYDHEASHRRKRQLTTELMMREAEPNR